MALFKISPEISRSTVKEFESEHGFKPTKSADLTEFGYAWERNTPKPEVSESQAADLGGPALSGAFVERQWTVRDKTPEEIADAVDQAREDAKRRMLDWINDFLAPLEAGYSKAEVDAFPAKGPAAENYSAGEARSADMLMLQAEADELGITVAEHVANILPKSRPYTKAVGITSALRQKTFAQIDAAQPADIPGILDAAKTAAMTKAAELGIA